MKRPAAGDNLIRILQKRAREQADQVGYVSLTGHHRIHRELSYGSLERDARTLAAHLQRLLRPGDRALLVYPTGLDVVIAFWACMYAGIVAVPAPGPDALRPRRGMARLQAIVRDAETSVILSTAEWKSTLFAHEELLKSSNIVCLATDDVLNGSKEQDLTYRSGAEDIAYLQYTSGSTSEPRGVVVTSRALLSHCDGLLASVGWDGASRSLSWLPYFHDYGLVHGIVAPLYAGMPAYLMSAVQFLRNPAIWPLAISQYRITHSGAPNFAYEMCARAANASGELDLRCWQVASCGAEPVNPESMNAFLQAFKPAGFSESALMPAYGLAEHVLVVSVARGIHTKQVDAGSLEQGIITEPQSGKKSRTFVSCGTPIAGAELLIVDPLNRSPCPKRGVGEIWVSSSSVAAGYWNKPEATKQVFEAQMASREGTYLRTGDLGFMEAGQLFVTGRLKDLIIVGGRNHYPQDIERTVQDSDPALRSGCGAAFAQSAESGERLVIVQEVIRGTDSNDTDRIAAAVRKAVLEEHNLPVFAVVLIKAGTIFKTSSGKVQRHLCRKAWMDNGLSMVGESVVPASLDSTSDTDIGDLEAALVKLWTTVLPQKAIGQHDNFFECGGHSLSATQVMLRISDFIGIELPLRLLFQHPTVAELAAAIQRCQQQPAITSSHVFPMVAVTRDGGLPLSFSQQRMWFMQQLIPDGTAYNMPVALRFHGTLLWSAFDQALRELVRRHESLRTTFHATPGGPVQIIQQQWIPQWEVQDLRFLPLEIREEEAIRRVETEARRPFNLSQGPVARFTLLQIDADDHIAVINMHHIVGDQWSYGLIGREFAESYNRCCRGSTDPATSMPVQYAEYAVWQRQYLSDAVLAPQLEYWRQKLADLPVLSLPTDFTRLQFQRYIGSYRSLPLSDTLLDAFSRLCAEQSATPFMGFLAAFAVLLCRYTGQRDVPVGVPVANRTPLATEGIVGTFVNTIILRSDLSGTPSFVELLQRVRATSLEAFEHQDLPFERLVDELSGQRDMSHSPLVQVLFNVVNAPIGPITFDGLSWSPVDFDGGAAQFDLTMTIDTELTQAIIVNFRTDLFAADSIDRMLEHYHTLLQEIIRAPHCSIHRYRLLPERERQKMLEEWNATQSPYPSDMAITDLIAGQAAHTPEAVALSMGEEQLTYRDVNSQANRLAQFLCAQGIQRGDVVGVALERTPKTVISLLGIMKAGAAYLPLDPTYPLDRLRYKIQDSGCSSIITTTKLMDSCALGHSKAICLDAVWDAVQSMSPLPTSGPRPSDVAYILYTSGSTGTPKGVEIRHRSLMNFLWSMRMRPGFSAGDRLLSVTSESFDIAALEFFLPLIAGGHVELVSRSVASDGHHLKHRMAEFAPTVMQATPATWRMLIEAGWKQSPGLTVLCGGEALTSELAQQILARADALWNMYGPTETTVWSTLARIEPGESAITIGRPIANTQIYVLDEAMEPVPIGVPGELYIGGEGVARGYHNRPDLTEERFVSPPFLGEKSARLYRTGDVVRYRSDGNIVYIGRQDFQVKIRGFRVELGEVEGALERHTSVKQAVVVAKESQGGDTRLIAYVVARGEGRPTLDDVKTHLRSLLPVYMVPTHWVWLDAIPLTLNGKVDRAKLPVPEEHLQVSADTIDPIGVVETQLAILWIETLNLSSVGRHDNFFDLGGHSLKAVQLFAKMEDLFGKQLPLATLFQAPTIASLSQVLTNQNFVPLWQSLVAIQRMGTAIPFFAVPGVGGNVLMFGALARLMGTDQPFYGLQAPGLDGREAPLKSVQALAAHYLREVEAVQQNGPYVIGGTCTGGVIAYEMAQQLAARGKAVVLILMETWHPVSYSRSVLRLRGTFRFLVYLWNRMVPFLASCRNRSWSERLRLGIQKAESLIGGNSRGRGGPLFRDDLARDRIAQATLEAVADYEPREYRGGILNIVSSHRHLHDGTIDTRRLWEELVRGSTQHVAIPAIDSGQLFVSPHVEVLAGILREYLRTMVRLQ